MGRSVHRHPVMLTALVALRLCLSASAASGNGGPIEDSGFTFERCKFIENTARRGGVVGWSSPIGPFHLFEDCEFIGNTANHSGGCRHALLDARPWRDGKRRGGPRTRPRGFAGGDVPAVHIRGEQRA